MLVTAITTLLALIAAIVPWILDYFYLRGWIRYASSILHTYVYIFAQASQPREFTKQRADQSDNIFFPNLQNIRHPEDQQHR